MLGLKNLFGGGDLLKSVETIATEWIETEKEQAEAKTLMIKALDPNGRMRVNISQKVCNMWVIYLLITLVLLIAEAFAIGPVVNGVLSVSSASEKIKELFMPVNISFGVILSASFGVNYVNVKNGK